MKLSIIKYYDDDMTMCYAVARPISFTAPEEGLPLHWAEFGLDKTQFIGTGAKIEIIAEIDTHTNEIKPTAEA